MFEGGRVVACWRHHITKLYVCMRIYIYKGIMSYMFVCVYIYIKE